jgi:hypothetical protein
LQSRLSFTGTMSAYSTATMIMMMM